MHPGPRTLARCLPEEAAGAPEWEHALAMLNGFFAVVRSSATKVVAAVDRVRSIPLFYGESQSEAFIGDSAEWVRQRLGDAGIEPAALSEFRLAGYVTGRDTLYRGVRQLQAGEMLIADPAAAGPAIATHRYYRFLHTEPGAAEEKTLRMELEQAALSAMRRLIDYAGGRQIVVPLSGGYDSRLIATLLRRLGYDNMLAFSYGVRGNKESVYSRQVAAALGLRWHFIEYGRDQWRGAWNTDERRQYMKWAFGGVSLPHIQDWAAVRALRDGRMIDEDSVFVPGHTGDFLSGGHIPDEAFGAGVFNADMLARRILNKHYWRSTGSAGPRPAFDTWSERIIERAEAGAMRDGADFANAFEKWEWQERQAKFIVNAVRVYEFFGYDWWLPLWDAQFVALWQRVPLELRRKRRWYLDYVSSEYTARVGLHPQRHLDNATDVGLVEGSVRSMLGWLPGRIRDRLKLVSHRLLPRRVAHAYMFSHLPEYEIRRLRSAGYRADGMVVQEFLKMIL